MDAVVYAAMQRNKAPLHLRVGGIDYRVCSQPGYIALPEVQPVIKRARLKRVHADYAPEESLPLQIRILHLAEFRSYRFRVPDVHERPKKILLL